MREYETHEKMADTVRLALRAQTALIDELTQRYPHYDARNLRLEFAFHAATRLILQDSEPEARQATMLTSDKGESDLDEIARLIRAGGEDARYIIQEGNEFISRHGPIPSGLADEIQSWFDVQIGEPSLKAQALLACHAFAANEALAATFPEEIRMHVFLAAYSYARQILSNQNQRLRSA